MKYGLDQNDKYWIEYTSLPRSIGNMRQELDLACQRIANERKTIISLSSGLDSQVVLHSFVQQGLPHECAFMYHPGFNDSEFQNIKILEKKYNFKCNIIDIDPNRAEWPSPSRQEVVVQILMLSIRLVIDNGDW